MKLSQRLQLLIKTATHDLFGEGPAAVLHQKTDDWIQANQLAGLLEDVQKKLDILRLELANTVGQQKRIEQARQVSAKTIHALDASTDAAIQAGHDEQAREYLTRRQAVQRRENELAELVLAIEEQGTALRVAINRQQEQLDDLRHRTLALTDRERTVTHLAELLTDQQSLSRQTEKLQAELATWEEQIARREDFLSIRREWSQ